MSVYTRTRIFISPYGCVQGRDVTNTVCSFLEPSVPTKHLERRKCTAVMQTWYTKKYGSG